MCMHTSTSECLPGPIRCIGRSWPDGAPICAQSLTFCPSTVAPRSLCCLRAAVSSGENLMFRILCRYSSRHSGADRVWPQQTGCFRRQVTWNVSSPASWNGTTQASSLDSLWWLCHHPGGVVNAPPVCHGTCRAEGIHAGPALQRAACPAGQISCQKLWWKAANLDGVHKLPLVIEIHSHHGVSPCMPATVDFPVTAGILTDQYCWD